MLPNRELQNTYNTKNPMPLQARPTLGELLRMGFPLWAQVVAFTALALWASRQI